MSRFHITKIAASGEKVEYSSVSFEDGVNFIVGPSNTGKSYVIGCIDFMFAGKEVPFSKDDTGYDTVMMEMEADARASGIEIANRDLLARIIQEKTEAYILDKAGQLGLQLQAEVSVSETEEPVPWAVVLSGEVKPDQKRRLEAILEQELGIARENQQWQ